MKKKIFILLAIISISCGNDDDIPAVDLTSEFLNETTPQFSASLDNFVIDYEFSLNYQMSTATFPVNGDINDPLRSLRFVLNQELGDNQFVLRTPNYDSSTPEGFDSLFALGPKLIGETTDTYRIQFTRFDETYYLCDEDAGIRLEVLKTEETVDEIGDVLYVWYKLGDVPLNLCNSNDDKVLSDAYILVQFRNFRFE